ncbi:MAG: hypothetical protein ACP5OE_08125 [Thermodesulfobium sp.]
MKENYLSIYVSSCDKYSWLWPSFFHYLNKFWPDCPYKVYLGSETLKFRDRNVIVLDAGVGIPWGKMTRTNLEKIDTKYVLFMLDDFLLENYVDSKIIEAVLNLTVKMNANHIRLNENGSKRKLKNWEIANSFVAIDGSKKSMISLQAAIWNRKFLLSILNNEESPWEFEILGSERVKNGHKMYYLKKAALVYHFGGIVHQGLIERKYARMLFREHIWIDRKKVMTRREQLLKYIEDVHNYLHLNSVIPNDIKQYVKKHLSVDR